uniref:Uncharacterized protein n=1 Tax=Arundo donax TaxID=35708 RepID=A0A0A8XP57_ARUDO
MESRNPRKANMNTDSLHSHASRTG